MCEKKEPTTITAKKIRRVKSTSSSNIPSSRPDGIYRWFLLAWIPPFIIMPLNLYYIFDEKFVGLSLLKIGDGAKLLVIFLPRDE